MRLFLIFLLCLCCFSCGIFESESSPTVEYASQMDAFASKTEDLPDDYMQFMDIDNDTKDISVTLRVWDGPLPGGLKIRLFTRRSENLVFKVLPPSSECMDMEKKAVFLFSSKRNSYAKFGWRAAKRYNVIEVATSLNQSLPVYSQPGQGDFQFSVFKVEHSLAQLNVVGNSRGSSDSRTFYIPGNFEWRKARDVNQDLDTDNFPFFDDFGIGNEINRWTSDLAKKFVDANCSFKFFFSGDAYRVLTKDAATKFSITPTTVVSASSDFALVKPPEATIYPKKRPEKSKLVSVLVGVNLFQGISAVIVLFGITMPIVFRYYFPKNEKPIVTNEALMIQPSSGATLSKSVEVVKAMVSTSANFTNANKPSNKGA